MYGSEEVNRCASAEASIYQAQTEAAFSLRYYRFVMAMQLIDITELEILHVETYLCFALATTGVDTDVKTKKLHTLSYISGGNSFIFRVVRSLVRF